MQIHYTHQWTSAFPTTEQRLLAAEVWGKELAGLTADQIAKGLDNLPLNHPPSPGQFKELCAGYSEHNTAAYKTFDKSKALEHKANKSKAKTEIDKIKALLGK